MIDKHVFLTSEWLAAAKAITDSMPQPGDAVQHAVTMNQVITEVPFNGGSSVEVHVRASGGKLVVAEGHMESPDMTVTVDWVTARSIIVDQDMQAAMTAFLSGRIEVSGDLMKLMTILQEPPSQTAREIAAKIKEITAED